MSDSCGINNPTSTAGVRSPNPPRIYKAVVGGAPANTFMPIGIRFCDLYYDGFNDNVYMFIGSSGGLATWELITGGAFVLPLAVSSGGTGDATLTAHNVLIGEGTSPVAFAAPSATSGVPLVSAGAAADPAFGTAVVAGGGTGAVTLTTHGVLVGEGTSAVVATAAGTTGQVLTSGGASADPTWTTATYPATTTINQLIYSSAANALGGLATTNTGSLVTSSTGVPSIQALNRGQAIVGMGASATPQGVYFSNTQISYVPSFNAIPITSASTGGTSVVTINKINLWSFPQWGAYFEAYNTVALQAIVPALSTTAGRGLNIDSATGANAAAIELTEGNSVNCKNAFTTGSSAAFYVQAKFNIAVLNTIQNVNLGFRIVQAYQGTSLATYTDYAAIGILGTAGEFEIQTQKASGGETDTDTTQAATAATTYTLRVNVSSTGVVTYTINGAPPTVTAAYTFTASTVVIPFMFWESAAGAHGEMDLVSYQCGLQ